MAVTETLIFGIACVLSQANSPEALSAKANSVRFQSTTESLDTNSPMGLALLTILGCLAQLERELLRERVLELDTLRLLGFVKSVENVYFHTVA